MPNGTAVVPTFVARLGWFILRVALGVDMGEANACIDFDLER